MAPCPSGRFPECIVTASSKPPQQRKSKSGKGRAKAKSRRRSRGASSARAPSPTPSAKAPARASAQTPDVSPAGTADIELDIVELASGGDGVGRDADGRVTFVPGVAPGERVRVRVERAYADYARAALVDVIAPAVAARRVPPCPHAAQRSCGGCQWQHLSSEAQRQAKDALCERALGRYVEAGMHLAPIAVPSAKSGDDGPGDEGLGDDATGMRRRARLHWFRPRKASTAQLGFFAPQSHQVTDVPHCMQLEPALDAALAVIRTRLLPVLGRRGQMHLLAGHQGHVHLAIEGRCDVEAAQALVGHGGIVGVALRDAPPNVSRDVSGDARGRRRTSSGPSRHRTRMWQVFGCAEIEVEPAEGDVPALLGRAYQFAQPSLMGNRLLCQVVADAVGPTAGKRILELYAGSGNFTRMLAKDAAQVVAVDRSGAELGSAPYGVKDDVKDDAKDDAKNVRVQRGDVVRTLSRLQASEQSFDIAVLDPPRTGARDAVASLVAMAPARIVYVACDLATLARDLGDLGAGGYRPISAQPVDLMPHTPHIETVVVLTRHEANS